MGDWVRHFPPETLLCPVCGLDYSHIREVFTRLGSDRHEAQVYVGTQVKEFTEERRSALVIALDGECGHRWNLTIQQHKGNNFVDIEIEVEADSADRGGSK
jgi:hypothetical protein